MLGWKSTFPEASSAIVFPIGHACYAFVDDSHKPTNIHLTCTPERYVGIKVGLFWAVSNSPLEKRWLKSMPLNSRCQLSTTFSASQLSAVDLSMNKTTW
jgi:hypothetical protein